MNANTVYDIFLALPEEKQRHIELVNRYNSQLEAKIQLTQNKEKTACLLKDAMEYL
jgi:hypothetical protein